MKRKEWEELYSRYSNPACSCGTVDNENFCGNEESGCNKCPSDKYIYLRARVYRENVATFEQIKEYDAWVKKYGWDDSLINYPMGPAHRKSEDIHKRCLTCTLWDEENKYCLAHRWRANYDETCDEWSDDCYARFWL